MVEISASSKFDHHLKDPLAPLVSLSSTKTVFFILQSNFECLRSKWQCSSCIKTLPSIICRQTPIQMGVSMKVYKLFHDSTIDTT